MYIQPKTYEDLLAFPTEDPSGYVITKELRFLLVGCKIFGLKKMSDIRKKEKFVLQKFEFWKRKNRNNIGKTYFLKYESGMCLLR